ncbi:MAG TPA: OB-fold nucleic acid binding domain-containing protein, partial [Solirubrobacteraceae bacterium]
PYIERRQRLRVEPDYKIPFDHHSLEPVLKETLGTIIFQDQVIEVAMAFSGFSPGQAEGLRRAMSRKRSAAAIEEHHRDFVEGAMAKWPDVDEALAERVWSMVVGFSGFGFPKAHGAAFGLLAYQSTWLRVHYGPEFLCSLLDEQPMGFYPPDALVHEAQRRGIEVLPPDINASDVGCTVVDAPAEVLPFRPRPSRSNPLATPRPTPPTPLHARAAAAPGAPAPPAAVPPALAPAAAAAPQAPARSAVRLGLGYVLGVRADEVAALVAARTAGGPFQSLDDLASRAGAGRPALTHLAWSGACDALSGGRRTALWRLGAAAPAYGTGGGATQLSLALELPTAPELSALSDWDAMIADYATTGLTVDRHPLRLLRKGLAERGIASSADLDELPHDAQVRVAGLVVARQRPGTAKGVVFLLLEDETGTVNIIVPPKVYERDRLTVRTEPLVMVEGTLERFASAGGAINLLVSRVRPLEAPELLDRRPRAEVKDFSMLDARELARIQSEAQEAEQPRVAVAVAGGATADHVRPAASASGPPTDGAEDFRAVAPPIMSFAQGRRR